MKTIKFLLIGLGLFTFMGIQAQVSIEDANTVKLGSSNNIIESTTTGQYGQFQGISLGNIWDKGTLIESGNNESGGIYMDGDKVIIWSPGDDNLVNFCDEDLIQDSSSDFHQAIIAYIDGNGYYYQISDSTRKEQITTISSSLSKIMKLRGVEYYHKRNNEKAQKSGNSSKTEQPREKKSGFLAQEVETIVPEAVSTNKAGVKFVNYQAMIPFLVEALKEQQGQIEQLKKENEAMKNDIDQIKKALELDKVK